MTSDPGSAAEYWGTLFTGPKPSEMFHRLNLAIIDFARAVNNIDTPSLPQNTAYTLLAPQHFFTIMPIFSTDSAGFTEILKHVPQSFYSAIAVVFYEALDIEHLGGPACISRKACQRWMCRVTRAYPDEMHASLNELLQSDRLLIDPLTEQKFTFKEIPRSCFPPTPDLELKKMYQEKSEGIEPKMAEIVRQINAAAQAAQSSATSQQREAVARADLAAAEMRRDALLGQTYYDSRGKKKYREGAFDSLDRANF